MTWPHQDPELQRELEAKAEKGLGCRLCGYWTFGPGLAGVCAHPEHSCIDGRRLTTLALGCPDKIDRDYKPVGIHAVKPVASVSLAEHCEQLFRQRIRTR